MFGGVRIAGTSRQAAINRKRFCGLQARTNGDERSTDGVLLGAQREYKIASRVQYRTDIIDRIVSWEETHK